MDRGTTWADARHAPESATDSATSSVSSFAVLDDGECDASLADSLNNWAHVVIDAKQPKSQRGKRATTQKHIKANTTSVDELAAIKSQPKDFKSLARIARNHPSDDRLRPGEQWVMMDSGANIDAANISEHFPEYLNCIESLNPMSGDGGAECASGSVVKCRGKANVRGSLDGQSTSIVFRDMDIRMPIASMRKRVHGAGGFDVFLTNGGAMMRHRTSGKLVKLYDRGGVYFAKFKTHLPDLTPHEPEQPFQRLG